MADNAVVVGLISYDHVHLKTEQLVNRLLLKARRPGAASIVVKILALPFSPRPKRAVLFEHRPDQEQSVSTRELARSYDIEFIPCTYQSIPDVADYYLVAGGGILAASAIGQKKIINAHPGIIPAARGLDAFKWTIWNQFPLGVTLHYIDAEVDAGEAIGIFQTPVFPGDDLATLARRHYELELDVLSEFLGFLGAEPPRTDHYPTTEAQRRMPIDREREMVERFPAYRERFSKTSVSEWNGRGGAAAVERADR